MGKQVKIISNFLQGVLFFIFFASQQMQAPLRSKYYNNRTYRQPSHQEYMPMHQPSCPFSQQPQQPACFLVPQQDGTYLQLDPVQFNNYMRLSYETEMQRQQFFQQYYSQSNPNFYDQTTSSNQEEYSSSTEQLEGLPESKIDSTSHGLPPWYNYSGSITPENISSEDLSNQNSDNQELAPPRPLHSSENLTTTTSLQEEDNQEEDNQEEEEEEEEDNQEGCLDGKCGEWACGTCAGKFKIHNFGKALGYVNTKTLLQAENLERCKILMEEQVKKRDLYIFFIHDIISGFPRKTVFEEEVIDKDFEKELGGKEFLKDYAKKNSYFQKIKKNIKIKKFEKFSAYKKFLQKYKNSVSSFKNHQFSLPKDFLKKEKAKKKVIGKKEKNIFDIIKSYLTLENYTREGLTNQEIDEREIITKWKQHDKEQKLERASLLQKHLSAKDCISLIQKEECARKKIFEECKNLYQMIFTHKKFLDSYLQTSQEQEEEFASLIQQHLSAKDCISLIDKEECERKKIFEECKNLYQIIFTHKKFLDSYLKTSKEQEEELATLLQQHISTKDCISFFEKEESSRNILKNQEMHNFENIARIEEAYSRFSLQDQEKKEWLNIKKQITRKMVEEEESSSWKKIFEKCQNLCQIISTHKEFLASYEIVSKEQLSNLIELHKTTKFFIDLLTEEEKNRTNLAKDESLSAKVIDIQSKTLKEFCALPSEEEDSRKNILRAEEAAADLLKKTLPTFSTEAKRLKLLTMPEKLTESDITTLLILLRNDHEAQHLFSATLQKGVKIQDSDNPPKFIINPATIESRSIRNNKTPYGQATVSGNLLHLYKNFPIIQALLEIGKIPLKGRTKEAILINNYGKLVKQILLDGPEELNNILARYFDSTEEVTLLSKEKRKNLDDELSKNLEPVLKTSCSIFLDIPPKILGSLFFNSCFFRKIFLAVLHSKFSTLIEDQAFSRLSTEMQDILTERNEAIRTALIKFGIAEPAGNSILTYNSQKILDQKNRFFTNLTLQFFNDFIILNFENALDQVESSLETEYAKKNSIEHIKRKKFTEKEIFDINLLATCASIVNDLTTPSNTTQIINDQGYESKPPFAEPETTPEERMKKILTPGISNLENDSKIMQLIQDDNLSTFLLSELKNSKLIKWEQEGISISVDYDYKKILLISEKLWFYPLLIQITTNPIFQDQYLMSAIIQENSSNALLKLVELNVISTIAKNFTKISNIKEMLNIQDAPPKKESYLQGLDPASDEYKNQTEKYAQEARNYLEKLSKLTIFLEIIFGQIKEKFSTENLAQDPLFKAVLIRILEMDNILDADGNLKISEVFSAAHRDNPYTYKPIAMLVLLGRFFKKIELVDKSKLEQYDREFVNLSMTASRLIHTQLSLQETMKIAGNEYKNFHELFGWMKAEQMFLKATMNQTVPLLSEQGRNNKNLVFSILKDNTHKQLGFKQIKSSVQQDALIFAPNIEDILTKKNFWNINNMGPKMAQYKTLEDVDKQFIAQNNVLEKILPVPTFLMGIDLNSDNFQYSLFCSEVLMNAVYNVHSLAIQIQNNDINIDDLCTSNSLKNFLSLTTYRWALQGFLKELGVLKTDSKELNVQLTGSLEIISGKSKTSLKEAVARIYLAFGIMLIQNELPMDNYDYRATPQLEANNFAQTAKDLGLFYLQSLTNPATKKS